jgi:hypothetical protein
VLTADWIIEGEPQATDVGALLDPRRATRDALREGLPDAAD